MNIPDALYQRVYASLKGFCATQKQNETALRKVAEYYKTSCADADKQLQSQLRKNAEDQAKVKAFKDIASAHSSSLADDAKVRAFDPGTLSKLAVQIDTQSRHDAFASQLYTQSMGQLRFLQRAANQIQAEYEATKQKITERSQIKKGECEEATQQLHRKIAAYFCTEEFARFLDAIKTDYDLFGNAAGTVPNTRQTPQSISLGTKRAALCVPDGFAGRMANVTQGLYDPTSSTIGIPVSVHMLSGAGILISYKNENERSLLSGIQNFLLNTAKYFGGAYEQVVYIDPVRFNDSSLGILQPLAAGNVWIDSVPLSSDEIKRKLTSVIASLQAEQRRLTTQGGAQPPKRMLIFHNFPQAYDASMIAQIRQLFVNAEHYNMTVLATHNSTAKNYSAPDTLDFIHSIATYIGCDESGFNITDASGTTAFAWYQAPADLPAAIKQKYVYERPVVDTSNDYGKRVGFMRRFVYPKGDRQITNIPYGIDAQGKVLTLDFEDGNFATFICGAARSGKSVLLHTLITGIIQNNHPDDVELWLIDFKMTEFSQYIAHRPPHVRYIILDESPELMCDILDRLLEILMKRQNIFMGKWQKLSEVPPDRYMPAILVIVDEFSVMSQVLTDSVVASRGDYVAKLQTLLSRGAALGLHFIFASQGFASIGGSRVLNETAKLQIQQRIAMKTGYDEIRDTLGLKSPSDDDRAIMEQLPRHYALVRIPVDAQGNHLQLAHVLFIPPDDTKQGEMIDAMNKAIVPAPKYNAQDTSVYIDKKALTVDGNTYIAFASMQDAMQAYQHKWAQSLDDAAEATLLFPGEPKRMLPLCPIEIFNSFCENVLMVAPVNEKMPATSVLMSIAASLRMQGKKLDVWTTSSNAIYRQMTGGFREGIHSLAKDLDEVCASIRTLKDKIQAKAKENTYIVILGAESLLMDMQYQADLHDGALGKAGMNPLAAYTIEKRAPGELDLNSLREALEKGLIQPPAAAEAASAPGYGAPQEENAVQEDAYGAYNAREDLRFLLAQGPRMGYHLVVVFNTVGELKQSKLDVSLFKHRILFRLSKEEAGEVAGFAGAGVFSELNPHAFRYTNGLDALSYRPYLHPGLSWDGWQMRGKDVVITTEEEDEYLI